MTPLLMPTPRWPESDEAWIGVGANLGDRRETIDAALALFSGVAEVSPLLETEPWGIRDQPWFLNGVFRLVWEGSPYDLLRRCLSIEQELGRIRGVRNGPRVIDLDVLIAGRERLRDPALFVPHPGIETRRSVLEPWARVAPELLVPGLGVTIGELRARAADLPGQVVREPAGPTLRPSMSVPL